MKVSKNIYVEFNLDPNLSISRLSRCTLSKTTERFTLALNNYTISTQKEEKRLENGVLRFFHLQFALKKTPNLEYLRLSDNCFTGIGKIPLLKKLKEVVLDGHSFTPKQWSLFKESLPSTLEVLKIIGFPTPKPICVKNLSRFKNLKECRLDVRFNLKTFLVEGKNWKSLSLLRIIPDIIDPAVFETIKKQWPQLETLLLCIDPKKTTNSFATKMIKSLEGLKRLNSLTIAGVPFNVGKRMLPLLNGIAPNNDVKILLEFQSGFCSWLFRISEIINNMSRVTKATPIFNSDPNNPSQDPDQLKLKLAKI